MTLLGILSGGGLLISWSPNLTHWLISQLAIYWNNLTASIEWWEPKGLYWICGEWVYTNKLSQQLVQILCAGHNLAFFFLAPPQTRWKIRSLHIWGKGKQEKVRCPTNRGLEWQWVASRVEHSILWSCYMGRRWLLELSHPNLYAQPHHLASGSDWNYN
jgi:hypothetical protein